MKQNETFSCNNIRVAIANYNTKTVSISVAFLAGSMYEKVNGTAHMVEHLLTEYLKRTPEYKVLRSFGVDMNAMTGKKYLVIKFLGLNCTVEYILKAIASINDFEPKFADVENEKRVIEREIELSNHKIPMVYINDMYKKTFSAAFGKSILGTKDSIKQIEVADLKEFFLKHIVAENMAISICGNVNRDTIEEAIGLNFRKWRHGKVTELQHIDYQQKRIAVPGSGDKFGLVVEIPIGKYERLSADCCEIMNELLFADLDSLVFNRLRSRGYIYSMQGMVDIYIDYGASTLFFYVFSSGENRTYLVDYLKREIYEDINAIKEEEFIFAKNRVLMKKYKMFDQHFKYSTFKAKRTLDELQINEEIRDTFIEECEYGECMETITKIVEEQNISYLVIG